MSRPDGTSTNRASFLVGLFVIHSYHDWSISLHSPILSMEKSWKPRNLNINSNRSDACASWTITYLTGFQWNSHEFILNKWSWVCLYVQLNLQFNYETKSSLDSHQIKLRGFGSETLADLDIMKILTYPTLREFSDARAMHLACVA